MKKVLFLIVFSSTTIFSQNLKTKFNWHNLDYDMDGLRGMSTERAYKDLLKGKTSQKVIVGVIDSGIDIKHEDLQRVIWINKNEIPGNGKDDDNNGFIDDVYGWDFIGGADGTDVNQEQLESIRIINKLNAKFGVNPKKRIIRKNKADWELLKKLKLKVTEERKEAEQYLPMYSGMLEKMTEAEKILAAALGKEEFNVDDVSNIKEAEVERNVRQAKLLWLNLANMGASKADLTDGVNHFRDQIEFNLNPNFDARKVVGDDPDKLGYGTYGNNEVTGPDAMHGTHVAGIIGGDRTNNKGILGVADNVEIMTIRCVPNGDERDKDVANAIKYAVDNGAQIINMSFGKPYSPDKKWVDEAMLYAQSKGVLLVSASGNDNLDIDEQTHYPTRNLNNGTKLDNWIVVGALNFEEGEEMPANFSNYGQTAVDVFAPGVAIYSTVPGSRYEEKQGTSMAAPAVAGVAALLKSYFPTLTSVQLRDIIMKSAVDLKTTKVNLPGEKSIVDFGQLSVSGGVVNVYNAVKMAMEITTSK